MIKGLALILKRNENSKLNAEDVVREHISTLNKEGWVYFSTGYLVTSDPEILVLKCDDKYFTCNVLISKTSTTEWLPRAMNTIPELYRAPRKTWILLDRIEEINPLELEDAVCYDGTPLLSKLGAAGVRFSNFVIE